METGTKPSTRYVGVNCFRQMLNAINVIQVVSIVKSQDVRGKLGREHSDRLWVIGENAEIQEK